MHSLETRTRNAERSRASILDAAEQLFAARGFAGTSLGEIGAAAGVSRSTPSYFFGSKDQLYAAVLERLFADRDMATRHAFEPLARWASGKRGGSLRSVLREAVTGYVDFLQGRPAFVQLLQREELGNAERLGGGLPRSSAMSEAFSILRRSGAVGNFNVDDAVLVFVSLTFSPLTQRSTFMTALGRNLDDERTRRQHVSLVVDQLLHLIQG
jgi:TetR/AcrR family transcriptional regulator